jgi:hypothetical protein
MPLEIQISGKELGALALPASCPRCFWIQHRSPHGLPYQMPFPGIFSSIDSYSKRVVHGWFDHQGTAPAWLADLGPITGYRTPPHHSKFRIRDQATNILLTGSPDGVFVRPDGSHLIVDYKTAKFTVTQDSLLPMYKVQLNAYAVIGQAAGLRPVSGLALVYTEPVTDQESAESERHQHSGGFAMSFSGRVLPVELDTSVIPPLLRHARDILEHARPPSGRVGCKECSKLDALIGMING